MTTRLCIVMGGHWDAQIGGAQYQGKCLADALAAYGGFEVYYLANVVPPELRRDGYEIVPFGGAKVGRLRTLPHLPALYALLKKLRPAVVYQRCLMPYTGACAFYCQRYGARFVFHIASDDDVRRRPRGNWGEATFRQRLDKRIGEYGLRRADAIVAQTHEQAEVLGREYDLRAALVVPNFHPLPERSAAPRDANAPLRVAWAGAFKPIKNPELFVDLAEALANRPDIEFVMMGDPGLNRYAELHNRINKLPNLRYVGEVPLDRVNDELAVSDLFVNTSSAEGFPNTFIQAWLRGVPVVSCFVDPDQCLSKGGAGVLVGSAERLASVVLELAADRPRLQGLAATARAHAEAKHGPENARSLIRLLETIAA